MKAPQQNDTGAVRAKNNVTLKTNGHLASFGASKSLATREHAEQQNFRYILIGEWRRGYNFYKLYPTKKSAIRARNESIQSGYLPFCIFDYKESKFTWTGRYLPQDSEYVINNTIERHKVDYLRSF